MVFEELVTEVCELLNLTSQDARSRVGRAINRRYRRITSSIGLETSRRAEFDADSTVGERTLTFEGVEKLMNVIDRSSGKDVILNEVGPEEIITLPVRDSSPRNYAVTRIHPDSVEITTDCEPPVGTEFTLYAQGHENTSTLAGNQSPDFPESFHEILVFGAMADEYRKMEKVQLSRDCELDYERRLSDLRMWIAKSAYHDVAQGLTKGSKEWWGPRSSWGQ
jgi:hypothetical protein